MKFGRLPQNFLEGMVCQGGCVGGPSSHRSAQLSAKDRNAILENTPDINIKDNLESQKADSVFMVR
jgi:iron only hydrogenase large subunit-like protein